jgi:homoserine kinase type II
MRALRAYQTQTLYRLGCAAPGAAAQRDGRVALKHNRCDSRWYNGAAEASYVRSDKAVYMLNESDIANALACYELGDLRSIRIAPHGLVNETAFAETSLGKYVIRRNQRRLGRASLSLRHRLMAWLQARGFPVPRLIRSRDGDTVVEVQDRLYEVTVFVEGDDFNIERKNQVRNAGTILASYHRAVREFPLKSNDQPPRYRPDTMRGLIERLYERDIMGDLTATLSWYDRRIFDLCAALPAEAYNALPHVMIHGDVHRDNFLFRGDMVVALLDFDQVTNDASIIDLVDGLVAFATAPSPEGWSPWGLYDGPLDLDLARLFLRGYTETLPLKTAERVALPPILETLWLQGNIRRVLLTPEGDPEYHEIVLDQGRWLSDWVKQHHDDLTDL